ncbi:MAG TPA: hypothetical protein DHV26_04545, partial [Cytophagales bacterium]|nr:hypothetical protein [Cytophagales bacterium]
DLDSIEKDFILFSETISKEYVQHHGRLKLFQEEIKWKTIVKTNNLKRKDDELVRNTLSHELIPIITEVFEEIYNLENLKDLRILEECYVKNEDIKKYNSELGFIFSDKPPTFDSRINPTQNTSSTHNQLKEQILNTDNKLPDPIIIIGGTGSGKTTFIKYFLEIELDKDDKKNRPVLYLDFRNETESTVKDTASIYRKLVNLLYQEYPKLNLTSNQILRIIYERGIENQKTSFWNHITDQEVLDNKISQYLENEVKDPIAHLTKISAYLTNQCNKRICIVIDNADQLKEEIQKEVFILGHSLHRNLKITVLISLREGYFYKFKSKPPFDAYHSTVFHITAPPYREVLKKRFKYVLTNFQFKKIRLNDDAIKMDFSEGSLGHLFEKLYKSLFEQSGSEILSFLEETSYPNIRNGLEKFKFFILSGHTKTNMYMSFEYGKSGRGGIPIWEFVKAVALESSYYYQSKKSTLVNLFYPSQRNLNHFTKIRLLDSIIEKNVGASRKNLFIPVSNLVDDFIKAGYTSDIILDELNMLYEHGLIFTNDFTSDIETENELKPSHHLGITQAGVFYCKNLINKFYYHDLIVQDTPIFDDKFFQGISREFPEADAHGNRDIQGRKKSVMTFLDYLQAQEILDHTRKENSYGIKSLDMQIIKNIRGNLSADFERIHRSQSSKW